MVVAILSDAPTLTTGFGVTTRRIADALSCNGHEVACFGLKATPEDVGDGLAYRVWPAEQGGHWTETLGEFLTVIKPRVVLLNMDAYNATECVDACRSAGWDGPVVSYVVFDGLPVSGYYLGTQRSCDAVLASSHAAADYLRASGVRVAGVAPPGVDGTVFRPPRAPTVLRERAGLADTTVVGVFATNTERKQIARVLAAFPAMQAELRGSRLALYLHCRPTGHWRLADMATDLGIADRVLFPAPTSFDERRGVPTAGGDTPSAVLSPGPTGTLPHSLSYVDRLNSCDVIINVPHSGDVEQVILESQACGVPLIHTDDNGVMAEAVGGGGVRLAARDVGVGRAGQRLHHVAPDDITAAAVRLLGDPVLRADMIRAGFENASSYNWMALEEGVCALIAPYV